MIFQLKIVAIAISGGDFLKSLFCNIQKSRESLGLRARLNRAPSLDTKHTMT